MGWRDAARGLAFILHDFASCYRPRPANRRCRNDATATFSPARAAHPAARWRPRCSCSARTRGGAEPEPPAPTILDPVVVTATRSAERAFDLPVAIDTVDKDQIQRDQLQINLSESLARVPGVFVQSRWNYAQDLALVRARLRRARQFRRARRPARTRTTFPPRCPTARARPAASASFPRSASKCCADRSRRFTAMRRGRDLGVHRGRAAYRRRAQRDSRWPGARRR